LVRGGFWGKGFMQGTQAQLDFIPERTTDFVFAAYSEEFGLLGNILLFGWIFGAGAQGLGDLS
jgi:rod shape determining protein RodA